MDLEVQVLAGPSEVEQPSVVLRAEVPPAAMALSVEVAWLLAEEQGLRVQPHSLPEPVEVERG